MSVRSELRRPLRNRVTPTGAIVAHPARGLLMGNRGCLHEETGAIIRNSARSAWISCVTTWPGRQRQLMRPGWYTELFFLDEATAFASGHRPCGECRAGALAAFKAGWARAHGSDHSPRVAQIDAVLRASTPAPVPIDDLRTLPDGAMIAVRDQPHLRWRGRWLPWGFAGYGAPTAPDAGPAPTLLTPAPIVAVLRAGYRPIVHDTVNLWLSRPTAFRPPASEGEGCH